MPVCHGEQAAIACETTTNKAPFSIGTPDTYCTVAPNNCEAFKDYHFNTLSPLKRLIKLHIQCLKRFKELTLSLVPHRVLLVFQSFLGGLLAYRAIELMIQRSAGAARFRHFLFQIVVAFVGQAGNFLL